MKIICCCITYLLWGNMIFQITGCMNLQQRTISVEANALSCGVAPSVVDGHFDTAGEMYINAKLVKIGEQYYNTRQSRTLRTGKSMLNWLLNSINLRILHTLKFTRCPR